MAVKAFGGCADESTTVQQQALCTMQALHNEGPLVHRAFAAYFAERRDIFTEPADFAAFMGSIGYDQDRVAELYTSDEVAGRMSESAQRMYACRMPLARIVVDGRFASILRRR